MRDQSSLLALHLASIDEAGRAKRLSRTRAANRLLQALAADLLAARAAACLTQEDVAARMGTTRSVVSRLESGNRARPTIRTIERYAAAVGATVEIRVRARR